MTEIRFAGESEEYRKARNELLTAEIDLRERLEQVAEMRRKLPPCREVETDYVFEEGPRDLAESEPIRQVRLSELFAPGKDELIVDHLMFGEDWEKACPMCSMWADTYDAAVPHLTDRANFVIVAKADIGKLRSWARGRGWTRARLLSSRHNTFNRDYLVETEKGDQLPGVSVFQRRPDGRIFHTYSIEMFFAPGETEGRDPRGIDLMSPVYNLFDLLPGGRGDWYAKHSYD